MLFMDKQIRILSVENDKGEGLIVVFTDGTTSGYVVEELLELRPYRETAKAPVDDQGLR
jgi:hypothetical protein